MGVTSRHAKFDWCSQNIRRLGLLTPATPARLAPLVLCQPQHERLIDEDGIYLVVYCICCRNFENFICSQGHLS